MVEVLQIAAEKKMCHFRTNVIKLNRFPLRLDYVLAAGQAMVVFKVQTDNVGVHHGIGVYIYGF